MSLITQIERKDESVLRPVNPEVVKKMPKPGSKTFADTTPDRILISVVQSVQNVLEKLR